MLTEQELANNNWPKLKEAVTLLCNPDYFPSHTDNDPAHYFYTEIERARVYYQGPIPSVSFLVDDASVTELKLNHDDHTWRNITDQVIRTHRMSNIRIK